MKRIMALVVSVLLLVGLTACNQNVGRHADGIIKADKATIEIGSTHTAFDGMEIQIVNAVWNDEETKFDVNWINKTGHEVVYGDSYDIEREDGGKWTSCVTIDNLAFYSIGYELKSGATQKKTYKLTDIANLSFSDLKVRYFTGRSILISDTGQGKRYQYRNGCMTALGDLEISEWREMITELIAYRSEQELQKQLYEWCAEHTPWLHGKSEITDYALECHAARLFDDPLWADYIPFNRKYRPNVLDSAELIWAKTACCGTTQQFTVPQYQKICRQNFFCRTCNEWTTLIPTKQNSRRKDCT